MCKKILLRSEAPQEDGRHHAMVGDASMRRYPSKWEHQPDLAAKYANAVESQPDHQKISAAN
eukprot:1687518-Prymnesium_polylepis.1